MRIFRKTKTPGAGCKEEKPAIEEVEQQGVCRSLGRQGETAPTVCVPGCLHSTENIILECWSPLILHRELLLKFINKHKHLSRLQV